MNVAWPPRTRGRSRSPLPAMQTRNQNVNQALKWAWPIMIFFFSVLAIGLYLWTCRPPGIGEKEGEEAKQAHHEYVSTGFRKTTGAVMHCVGGDGLGIMTGMVIARAVNMSFWEEFWFEYAVGYAFGWFIFQLKSMTMMASNMGSALLMAFRAEFFSMLTVMAGMGMVMGYVTPLSVGEQPSPTTYAFWGFAMLGLLVGAIFTYPMNWAMVKLCWKHGMA